MEMKMTELPGFLEVIKGMATDGIVRTSLRGLYNHYHQLPVDQSGIRKLDDDFSLLLRQLIVRKHICLLLTGPFKAVGPNHIWDVEFVLSVTSPGDKEFRTVEQQIGELPNPRKFLDRRYEVLHTYKFKCERDEWIYNLYLKRLSAQGILDEMILEGRFEVISRQRINEIIREVNEDVEQMVGAA
jgi:hypothetical protein